MFGTPCGRILFRSRLFRVLFTRSWYASNSCCNQGIKIHWKTILNWSYKLWSDSKWDEWTKIHTFGEYYYYHTNLTWLHGPVVTQILVWISIAFATMLSWALHSSCFSSSDAAKYPAVQDHATGGALYVHWQCQNFPTQGHSGWPWAYLVVGRLQRQWRIKPEKKTYAQTYQVCWGNSWGSAVGSSSSAKPSST